MSAPHIPTPLEQLGPRPFSFYPPIRNLDHNEWLFRRADGNELHVVNTKSHAELCLPLRYLGGVSSIEEPVIIVGLVKDLEYREGVLVPHVQRVLEMPAAVARAANGDPRPWAAAPQPRRLAPVLGIRTETPQESRKNRKFLGAIAVSILIAILGMAIVRESSRVRFFTTPVRLPLPFTASDDYLSIVAKWGHPATSRSRPGAGGREFHLLRYPDHALTIVLWGADRDHAFYLGALGRGGRVLHSTQLPDGADSTALVWAAASTR
ncbi:MAG: hypothetical protein EXQ47_04700 [Bryobacterales bacterium]|nr:hypothetical protein [Bryobacterales bacterium]